MKKKNITTRMCWALNWTESRLFSSFSSLDASSFEAASAIIGNLKKDETLQSHAKFKNEREIVIPPKQNGRG